MQAELVSRHRLNRLKDLLDRHADRQAPTATTDKLFEEMGFRELSVEFDRTERALFYHMHPRRRPCFTTELLEELGQVYEGVVQLHRLWQEEHDPPIRYVVATSRIEGVFNLGGDIEMFAELIRNGDEQALERYARRCIDRVYTNAIDLRLPITTVSLVQGDALGGGFEAALSSDVIIAERRARFGLPEVLFNLFPGMGAYSLLGRRVPPALAKRMILDGRTRSAEELHDMGIVDILADDGQGREALYDYFRRLHRQSNTHRAVHQIARRVHPMRYSELADVVDLWVKTAMDLSETDLRRMERLAAAQTRLMARQREKKRAAGKAANADGLPECTA